MSVFCSLFVNFYFNITNSSANSKTIFTILHYYANKCFNPFDWGYLMPPMTIVIHQEYFIIHFTIFNYQISKINEINNAIFVIIYLIPTNLGFQIYCHYNYHSYFHY